MLQSVKQRILMRRTKHLPEQQAIQLLILRTENQRMRGTVTLWPPAHRGELCCQLSEHPTAAEPQHLNRRDPLTRTSLRI